MFKHIEKAATSRLRERETQQEYQREIAKELGKIKPVLERELNKLLPDFYNVQVELRTVLSINSLQVLLQRERDPVTWRNDDIGMLLTIEPVMDNWGNVQANPRYEVEQPHYGKAVRNERALKKRKTTQANAQAAAKNIIAWVKKNKELLETA